MAGRREFAAFQQPENGYPAAGRSGGAGAGALGAGAEWKTWAVSVRLSVVLRGSKGMTCLRASYNSVLNTKGFLGEIRKLRNQPERRRMTSRRLPTRRVLNHFSPQTHGLVEMYLMSSKRIRRTGKPNQVTCRCRAVMW